MPEAPQPCLRVFIDEVGTHSMKSCETVTERYLGLTGLIIRRDYEQGPLTEALAKIKKEAFGNADVVLHRRDIIDRVTPFDVLADPVVGPHFDAALLDLLANATYRAFTAVIDKREHGARYTVWRFHPYHYCLTVLLERYVQFMERTNTTGDVLVESRGKKENIQLEKAYAYLYRNGTEHVHSALFQKRLSSQQLKLQPKSANITGLQLVDLVANPSCRSLICQKTGQAMSAPFGLRIQEILTKNKYLKSPFNGKIEGWGTKWLP